VILSGKCAAPNSRATAPIAARLRMPPIFSVIPYRLAYDDLLGNSRLRRVVGKNRRLMATISSLSPAGDV
jgi:hypothetical protein